MGFWPEATVRHGLKRLTRIGVVELWADKDAELSEELVADTMEGDDVLRLSRVLLDLLTKTTRTVWDNFLHRDEDFFGIAR